MFFSERKRKLRRLREILAGVPIIDTGVKYWGDTTELKSKTIILPVEKNSSPKINTTNGILMYEDWRRTFPFFIEKGRWIMPSERYLIHLGTEAQLHPFESNANDYLDEIGFGIPLVRLPGLYTEKERKDITTDAWGIHTNEGPLPLLIAKEKEDGLNLYKIHQLTTGELKMARRRTGSSNLFIENAAYEYFPELKERIEERRELEEMVGRLPESHGELDLIVTTTNPDPITPPEPVSTEEDEREKIDWNQPRSIIRFLDKHMIGQPHAKQALAIAFSNYNLRIDVQDPEIPAENILLIGPTGSGKTFSCRLLAEELDIPYAETKLTGKSSAGYVGESLGVVFEDLREKTEEDAPYGIVFIDEFDKAVREDGDVSGFGRRIQDELIGYMDCATVTFDRDGTLSKKRKPLRTDNLLFILAGAFQGNPPITNLISQRVYNGNRFGFGGGNQKELDERELLERVSAEDVETYGIKPELVGRIPVIGALHPLTIDDKVEILRNEESSPLRSYKTLLRHRGYHLVVKDEAYQTIAESCAESTGARGLRTVCERLFRPIQLDYADYASGPNVIEVNRELAEQILLED